MGYQQKLLFICGAIAIGVAIMMGIRKFESSATEADLHALTIDLLTIANKAQRHYRTPRCLEGGGHSFADIPANDLGLNKLMVDRQNLNGSFRIINVQDQCLTLEATGKHDFDGDGKNLTIQMFVFPDSVQKTVISY